MKKLLIIASIFIMSCSAEDEMEVLNCRTITDKEIIYEQVSTGVFAPNYYFYLNGSKTKVIKEEYNAYSKGQEYCK